MMSKREEVKKKVIDMCQINNIYFQNVYSERRKGDKYVGGKTLKFYNLHKTCHTNYTIDEFIEEMKLTLGKEYLVKITNGEKGHITPEILAKYIFQLSGL